MSNPVLPLNINPPFAIDFDSQWESYRVLDSTQSVICMGMSAPAAQWICDALNESASSEKAGRR